MSAETLATTSSTGPAAGLDTWALWRAWYERQRAEEAQATVIPSAPCECPPPGEEIEECGPATSDNTESRAVASCLFGG